MRADVTVSGSADRAIVKDVGDGIRLDVWMSTLSLVSSRAQAKRMIEAGHVKVNGYTPSKAGILLKDGDEVEIFYEQSKTYILQPQHLPLDVVYDDDHVMVINKARGMVVHPAPEAGHTEGTLVQAVLHRYPDLPQQDDPLRPGIVHRLDKDTTGLIVLAKSDEAYHSLVQQLSDRTVLREYVAIVHGGLKADQGVIDAPISRHPTKRTRMAVVSDGRQARTQFQVVSRFPGYSLVHLRLETGRTHQIRVHLAHIGHPIVGDELYGSRQPLSKEGGYALHARRLGFIHPVSREVMEFEVDIPSDFQQFVDRLCEGK